METLDYTKLSKDITKDIKRLPYEPNKHLFTKVAFDVFNMNSSPVESLWILEDGEDGKQYLVARYDEPEAIEVKSDWNALSDREGKTVTLAYKNTAIEKFAAADFNFTPQDIHIFKQVLVKKLSSDHKFVEKLLKSQPREKLEELTKLFPELA